MNPLNFFRTNANRRQTECNRVCSNNRAIESRGQVYLDYAESSRLKRTLNCRGEKEETPEGGNDSRLYQYGSDWEPILFSIQNGGYNVYHKGHNFSKHAGGGYAEKVVGMILAVINGKQVEFLPEKAQEGRHLDVRFDNLTWDIKYINEAGEDTIRKYIRNGRKADRVLFFWQAVSGKIEILKSATARELGNAKKRGETFPGIFYLNAEGQLQEIKIISSELPQKATPTAVQKG